MLKTLAGALLILACTLVTGTAEPVSVTLDQNQIPYTNTGQPGTYGNGLGVYP